MNECMNEIEISEEDRISIYNFVLELEESVEKFMKELNHIGF